MFFMYVRHVHNVETLLKLFLAVSYGCFEIIAQLSWIYGHCYQAEGVRRYLEDMEDILKDFEKYSKAEDQEGKMPPGLFPPEEEGELKIEEMSQEDAAKTTAQAGNLSERVGIGQHTAGMTLTVEARDLLPPNGLS